MQPRVIILSLADPSGQIGLALDQRAIEAMGADAVPIPTGVIVSPDPTSPRIVPQAPRVLGAMLEEALAEPADGMLVGPLPRARQVRTVTRILGRARPETIVVSPFLPRLPAAPQLGRFGKRELVRSLVPEATVVVVHESHVALLVERSADDDPDEQARTAAAEIQSRGPMAAWVVGGRHNRGLDLIAKSTGIGVLDYPRKKQTREVESEAAALAALLARGYELDDAIRRAHRQARDLDGDAFLIPA
jgi:hydroxymethylpyrimidine/phosphomethylpyrimidine kinase